MGSGKDINMAKAMMDMSFATSGENRPIEVITEEILHYKRQAGAAILEIGRRLEEAKAQLSHGEWLPWLETKVEFSERMAQNFMRLAREWSNPQSLADLGAAKALMLLALPAEERESFVEEHDVGAMTSRELKKVIRERDEARAEKDLAEQARAKMEADMNLANQLLAEAEETRTATANQVAELLAELEALKQRPIEVVGASVPDAAALEAAREEGAASAREETERKLTEKLEKAKAAKREAEERAKSAAQERDALSERVEALSRKLKVTGDRDMAAFSIYFDAIQEDYNRLLGCLHKLSETPENHNKCVAALQALVSKLAESLPAKIGEGGAS